MVGTFFNDLDAVDEVASLLVSGAVGVVPADTIYGISACANEKSAERIFEIKERPANKNLITLASPQWLYSSGLEVPGELESVFPAPLTVILADESGVTHAVRCPADPFIQALVAAAGPIWSTSVNISGQKNLSHYDEILSTFSQKLDFIVRKRKESDDALPSTILDCTVRPFRLVRQGAFDASYLIRRASM